ncbi:hypothetical protein H0H93_014715 [Arthromyces matolae]|nr:hypothetical protein H0H93_014715 [Arthromyces matolae]
MSFNLKLDTPKRMGAGFTGILFIAGVTFYIAKRNIAEKRRLDLEDFRASLSFAMANMPKNPMGTRIPSLSVGQTIFFGGSIVAASLGAFYWNLRRMHQKKVERGDLPHYEYLLAHVASRGLANPVPGAAETPIPRHWPHGKSIPPPVKEHHDQHVTVANYVPSATSDTARARLEQPTPQRAKSVGSSLAYTKSPDYASSYEKISAKKVPSGLPTLGTEEVPEVMGASPIKESEKNWVKRTAKEDIPPTPLPRPNESTDTLRARLVYQSRKRGTLETDLLLSTFARDHLNSMTDGEMREYDRLLDEADWDIYYWATGKRTPPARWEHSEILKQLTVHAKNEGKVVRMMPEL